MNASTLDTALHWLLRTSLEASVLILAVLGLRVLLGARLGASWRIGLWVLVGVKLLLPACIPAGFGLGGWASSSVLQPAPVALISPATASPLAAAPTPSPAPPSLTATLPSTSRSLSPLHLIAILWFSGTLAVLGFALFRHHQFGKKLATCPRAQDPRLLALLECLRHLARVRQPVTILLLPPGTTPAITGIRSPRLLLPQDWHSRFDDASLRHVLLHELFHVRHRDLLWNWATLAVQALHWFNPLVWTIGSRFQADRELRCDAAVLAILSPGERLSYGHTLLRIQETFFAPPAMAGLAPCVRNHPTLLQRITMIAQPNRNRPWLQALFTLAFGVMTCYAFTTATAADEKEIPAKDRSREGQRSTEPGEKSTNEAPRTSREGDGKMTEGPRDGDRPKTGERDGDKPRTGEGDGDRPKTGARDGAKKPGTGDREGGPKTGPRDGERPKSGERDGKSTSLKSSTSGEAISVHLTNKGETVIIQGEEMPLNRLRGYLHHSMAGNNDTLFQITAESNVPYKGVTSALDALRDNGKRNVKFAKE